ncbi:MAG TPA: aldolase/citrate lyase family protein, partial [Acidimicrobiales bacterium]|nr:aldolase/citrate lyase family protein [Acidimicrobiales bacterium]
NSPAEAEAAVRACRYPPAGARSYGPLRANYWAGADYFTHANAEVCCIVMVETAEAVRLVEDIVSVPGVDAVYVGPADLSVSLGLSPAPDHAEEAFTSALGRIVDACRRHGVVPAIAGNQVTAPRRIEEGFAMVEVASDARLLAAAAAQALAALRPATEARTAYL